jgi:flagellar biosynthetic protein FliP
MTMPMAAWMRLRRHGWGSTNEMSASMILSTLAVIALDGAGLMSDVGTMLIVEHVMMLAGMFAVMLLRPEEYSHHHQHAAIA